MPEKAVKSDVWWLALDREFTSYKETKSRRAISQGFPQLGDLSSILPLFDLLHDRKQFDAAIGGLAAEKYGQSDRNVTRAPRALWYLFQIKSGDIVVALEGTSVKGICQPTTDAAESYKYQGDYHYAQSVCHPVDWMDWNVDLGPPPLAPAQGVLGVAALRNERLCVQEAWYRALTCR